ncbi:Rne/Rng family ribonuclease [Aliiruegeria sabulilitoris]|uniref:Rne/Rng family ribonuclease n=1 Tax=Aliiruegeria sabulilitoris TaxID=1510458 RepID=UPI00082ACC15|nr:Rne/Rng family ribonuclease [Aliiruegeria sabulilitoris]NDR54892.1 Rne/Rng family ribonuclease [Pseudoruegeria sp. M32A2M]
MAKKMLIDATHAEETRVVVVDGNKVDEFDFESVNKRQLAGNIYLAKVTRVEPSLQAAFVDYGGNRHGFLAFSEIHPDYYQIPVADRKALLAEEREANRDEEEEDGEEQKKSRSRSRRSRSRNRNRKDETQGAEAETRPSGIEGMDVVDLGDGGEDVVGLAAPVEVIEDGNFAAEITDPVEGDAVAVDDAPTETEASEQDAPEQAEAAVEPVEETADAADAPEQAETASAEPEAATAEVAAPGADDAAPEAAAEDAVETAEAVDDVEGAEPDADTEEAAGSAETESEDEDGDKPGRTMAARLEDDPADVVTSEIVEDDDAETSEGSAEEAAVAEDATSGEPTEASEPEASAEAEAVAEEPGETNTASEEMPAEVEVAEAAETPGSEDDATEAEAAAATEDTSAEDEDSASEDEDEDEDEDHPGNDIESVAEEDVQEEIRRPRKPRMRRYKIQEVIKVRQIMLVQVVKEERGNKGAALTTYLSLAGRYCVLMPNTARGGGISRKITNAADRKKLKEIAGEIDVPEGAGLIIRTAGAKRTKAEIKRDYEYLKRLWEQIRELTLKSIAPAPIYEEGNLIKRSIRDLYNRDIDEVFVEGEQGYRVAKDFMKMIMPSHAKNVKQYTEAMPLFARYQVESYLAAMFNPVVQLKSGGYIVIGVTEALVAIDVNSGRATKEGSIEETALKTNLEAAEEVARQLRLRDLAGLIVIDFIDMEERKNNAAVEKRFKDKLKTDRARIQVGRISGFGLLEMSRQRLRPGMLEATTQPCPACHGTGLLRSDDSIGLQILRQLEEEGGRRRSREVLVKAPVSIVNFLMNQKREHVASIEAQYGLSVRVEADPSLIPPDFSIEKFKTATRSVPEPSAPVISIDTSDMPDFVEEEEEEIVEAQETVQATEGNGDDDGSSRKKRRRRRRRRGGAAGDENQNDDSAQSSENGSEESSDEAVAEEANAASDEAENGEEDKKSGRSRRRRSRRRSGRNADDAPEAEASESDAKAEDTVGEASDAEAADVKKEAVEDSVETSAETAESVPEPAVDDAVETAPEASAETEAPQPETEAPEVEAEAGEAETVEAAADDVVAADEEPAAPEAAVEEVVADPAEAEVPEAEETVSEADREQAEAAMSETVDEDPKPKRRGWWSVGR